MPEWPNVGSADDARLSDALRRADAHAPASLYDAYAARLSDYAHALLGDGHRAADAVHDALVAAWGHAGRLAEPARLRAWLYALVRFQCATRAGITPPHGAPTGPGVAADEAADPELAAGVAEALAELARPEREVLELAVRHGLSPAEVGAVLGLTSRQTAARLARAKDHLENAAAAVVLARTGRAHCPDLSAMLDSIEGPLPELLRKRLARHIAGCEVCTEGRRRRVSAERLLDLRPIAFPPLSLRRRVIDTCVNPEREESRTMAFTAVGAHLDRAGFPVVPERRARRGARRSRRRRTPLLTVVTCAVLAAGGLTVAAVQESAAPGGVQALHPPVTDPGPAVFEPEPSDAQTPSPEPDAAEPEPTPAAAVPSPVLRSAPPSATPRSRPRPRRTTRPASGSALPARLAAACPARLGEGNSGVIQLSAQGTAISWTARTTGGLAVLPARGTLKAGAKARIVVMTDSTAPGSGTVAFRWYGGSPSCRISWTGHDDMPPYSDPLPDEPEEEPAPGPSGSPSGPAPQTDADIPA